MVSVKALLMVTALLTLCLLTTNTSAAYAGKGCCHSYSKIKPPFHLIRGYSVQSEIEICPISAIIFHTKNGRYCSNPAQNWVMDYVERLRNKARLVHNNSLKK
ncbi:C-C motif chemokine 20a.3 [Xyrichtys novacula]|uniref:C-C motif chemokine 20a.3 n=1 Tax=Xyrichtys novacula TaxID=13765 RepID=A0AAV1GES4_XYRNO|nr:C-C motif chemokine 20a.3 [Xyrichtys novacula]